MAGKLVKENKGNVRRARQAQAVGSAITEFIKGSKKKKKKTRMPGGKRAPRK